MNIAKDLPTPLSTFVVDLPAGVYYDFKLKPGSTYPLRGVTYSVDYGNIPGYIAEDTHELDLFVGTNVEGELGYIVVERGEDIPNEHKFYVGLTEAEVAQITEELAPVLLRHAPLASMDSLLVMIEKYKET